MAPRQTVSQTIADVIAWRPALGSVLKSFEPILSAQAEVGESLASSSQIAAFAVAAQGGLPWDNMQAERCRSGIFLLAGADFSGLAEAVHTSANALLPLLAELEAVKPHLDALQVFFGKSAPAGTEDCREALLEALVSGNEAFLKKLAADNDLEPAILNFVAGFIVAPVLRAVTAQLQSEEQDGPWDKQGMWQEGFCPVCGALPVIAWLDKRHVDERNVYLVGGGGKKHLHCGLCGANWQFRRNVCPSCGKTGNDVMEFLRESGSAHGERVDWCTSCKGYCPTVDLRERESVPHLDALALGMLHLDMVAARKKLRPLRQSFWNSF
jgi:FdhE protein